MDQILARDLNDGLPRGVRPFLEPDERSLIVIKGVPGAIVATDRRVIVERSATPMHPEVYRYDALTGVFARLEWLGRKYVALEGPSLQTEYGVFELGESRNATVILGWRLGAARAAVEELRLLIADRSRSMKSPSTSSP